MHRRLSLKQSSLGAAGCALATPARPRHTEHLIFIVNGGGARKKDYYENDSLCPNIRKIASEGSAEKLTTTWDTAVTKNTCEL